MYQTTAWPVTAPRSPISTTRRFFHSPKASRSGALEIVPAFFISRNTGLSSSCIRIHSDTPSSTTETRNGMRQPQALNASSPIEVRMPITISSARNNPSVAVVWIQLVNRPRLPAGACSAI